MKNAPLLKIKKIYRDKGALNALSKMFAFPFKFLWRQIKFSKKWVFGKLFEVIRKNKITYKGVVLSFDNEYFETKEKDRFLFGSVSFEENPILFSERYLSEDLPLIELGGCTGVVACVTDRLVANKHVVVEANPYIIPVLEQNKKTNGCNFVIVNKALGYKSTVDYYVSANCVDGGLYKKQNKKITVQAITLKELAKDFRKINLIVDIEGSEVPLIDNEIDLISEKIAVLIIEFHPKIIGEGEVKRIRAKLIESGMKLIENDENDSIFVNSNTA